MLWQDAKRTFQEDPRFRRIALVGAFTITSIMLFPHYQPIAKEYLKCRSTIHALGDRSKSRNAAFSMVLNFIADLRGNELSSDCF